MTFSGLTFAEALMEARRMLASSPTPQLDARVLLEHAAGMDRAELIGAEREIVPNEAAEIFAASVARRAKQEPVAYITGEQGFWEDTFHVGPGVLIPRPETEMLVDAGLRCTPTRILDLGTGSGCILLSLLRELPDANGIGIDASEIALGYARRNKHRLGLTERAELRLQTFAEALEAFEAESFDLVVANPPYVPESQELQPSVVDHEPDAALFSGADGLEAHRTCAAIMAKVLTPNGSGFAEIGHDQGQSALAVYAKALPGRTVRVRPDMKGLPRMVAVSPNAGL
ncbi:MAG: peptide chain release factor N(5)-glutamine methyltransferase [Pseudomonadota bacterium]